MVWAGDMRKERPGHPQMPKSHRDILLQGAGSRTARRQAGCCIKMRPSGGTVGGPRTRLAGSVFSLFVAADSPRSPPRPCRPRITSCRVTLLPIFHFPNLSLGYRVFSPVTPSPPTGPRHPTSIGAFVSQRHSFVCVPFRSASGRHAPLFARCVVLGGLAGRSQHPSPRQRAGDRLGFPSRRPSL